MLVEYRRWIRSHAHVAVSFVIGIAFGVSVVAIAFFADRSGVASRLLLFGAQATGHADIGEDLIWLFSGIAVGAGVASYGWWRDGKARAADLPEEDVLNRVAANPRLRVVRRAEEARPDSGE